MYKFVTLDIFKLNVLLNYVITEYFRLTVYVVECISINIAIKIFYKKTKALDVFLRNFIRQINYS